MHLFKLILVFLFLLKNISFSQTGTTPPTFQDRFSKKSGNMRLSATKFDLGKIRNNETRNDTIYVYNTGKLPMNISLAPISFPYIKVIIKGTPLKPGGQGYIALFYDGAKRNDYGFVMDRLQLNTDDVDQPQKFISITAVIEDYFPVPAAGDTLIVKSRIPELSYSYGVLKEGNAASHNFKIYNDGGKKLLLHKTKTSCVCLKAVLSKNELASGDSAVMHVDFDSIGKKGKESGVVYLYMNDPSMPEAKFEITGEIVK